MDHILTLDADGLRVLHNEIFPKIATRDTILFLGAGTSVTDEKRYLSADIISLYELKKQIDLGIEDIVKFVDVLSEQPWFDRNEFDSEVDEYLRKLAPNDTHRTIASIFWKEIITTNFDLLIEQAEFEITKTSQRGPRLVSVHSVKQYNRQQASDEIRYVKLNGCMSDRSEYPFVFASKDFERIKPFQKVLLGSLANLSPNIQFLSVGYSFSDAFAQRLWSDFDHHSAFQRRPIISVDPYVKDEMLPYMAARHTRVIRITAAEFFKTFNEWVENNAGVLADRYRYKYHDRNNTEIQIDASLRLRLGQDVKELSPGTAGQHVKAESFYRGDKPTFSVIKQDLDVVRRKTLENVKAAIRTLLSDESKQTIPLVFLEGSFGAGKTTFTYRVANELRVDEEFNAACFEIINPRRVKALDLAALFEKTRAEIIVLVANDVEPNSLFQALNDLRYQLSVEQFKGFKLIIIASIRENILQRYEISHSVKNAVKISVDAPLSKEEVRELLEKLRDTKLVQYRSEAELRRLIARVMDECDADLLLSYIDLLTDSHHDVIVREAFSELTETAQESILKISLLYRFGILMPMSLLRALIRKTWEEFRREVVDYDSKNIIVREETKQFGTDPDIFLRIKHRLVAELFIRMNLGDEDRRFQEYQKLLRQVNEGPTSAKMVVDLLKALRLTDDLSIPKLDKLFDEVSHRFQEDPHFAVHYAMNLQRRKTKEALLKGIDTLSYAASFGERRNNRIVHRRAVLNYELAIRCFEEGREVSGETRHFVEQAQTNFDLKLILDPCSDFSYVNYLEFLLWKLEKFTLDPAEEHYLRVQVEELIDQAELMVQDGIEHVLKQRDRYFALTQSQYAGDERLYLNKLHEQLNEPDLRPYALILLYYHYKREGQSDKCEDVIRRLEAEKHLDTVVRLLFKDYGEHLHDVNMRQKLLSLDTDYADIVKKDTLRYYYYRYVAYTYNRQFNFAREELDGLRRLHYSPNPEIQQMWLNEEGEPRIFEAKRDQVRRGSAFLPEIQKSFPLRGPRPNDETFHVIVRFLVSGPVAMPVPNDSRS